MGAIETQLNELLSAKTSTDVEKVISRLGELIEWVPLGGNKGNFGIILIGADPYDAVTERITNAIDAMIELDVELRPELKKLPNPRRAIEAIYGFDGGYLKNCEQSRIAELATNIKVKFLDSETPKKPTIEILDRGIGQHPADFPNTLVGLNEDYKVSKLYLMGAFGQGGQTSLGYCDYCIIISRKHPKLLRPNQRDLIGWTIVRYWDPTTSDIIFKRGCWEYCVEAGSRESPRVLTVEPSALRILFEHGTLIRLVAYDMPRGTSDVLQPARSAWSYLSQSLFDPLLPIRLYEAREDYEPKNRPLSGLATRLWGGGKGEKAQVWKSDSYKLALALSGFVWINYWALTPTNDLENWRDIRKGFVSGSQAVFITLNGQKHGVEQTGFLRDRVNLTYSDNYIIVQLDCDGLTNQAKKELLSTTRDRLKEGEFKENLMEQVVEHLRDDRNILAFEKERRQKILSARSERDTSKIRSLVAKYIANNPQLSDLIQSKGRERAEGEKQKREEKESSPETEDIIREEELEVPDLKAVPTYLRITNSNDPISIEKGGNALIRLETDADDKYLEAEWETGFRCIHRTGLTTRRSCSRLRNGKISYHVHCPMSVRVGEKEELSFELDLPMGPPLQARCTLICVQPYERKKEPGRPNLPEPNIVPVSRENETLWAQFGWNDDSVGRVYLDKPQAGIYVSTENKHLQSALRKKKFDKEVIKAIEERYVAGVAYYLLLKKAQEMTHESKPSQEDDELIDASPELVRLAQTISALSLPIEAL